MLSLIFGLVGVVVGVLWLVSWGGWSHFLVVLQGSLPPFLILVGAVAIAAGISNIKDNMEAKKEEEEIEDEISESESSEDKPEEEPQESVTQEEEKKEDSQQ